MTRTAGEPAIGAATEPVFTTRPAAAESAADWRSQDEAIEAGERLIALLRTGAPVPELSARAWTALIDEAFRHRVAQLVYAKVRAEPTLVPPPALARLRDFFARSSLRTALNLRELHTLARLLGEQGIEVVALKGACLALEVYPEPALRPMADLDVLVRQERLGAAERALIDAGWRSAPGAVELPPAYHHLAPLERQGGATVEIHWTIERPTSPFRIDLAALWARTRPATRATGLLVPAPEDLLLHLALHLAYHHRFERAALKQLVDVATVVDRHGSAIDWERMARDARESGAAPFVRLTLRLAREMLDAPIPDAALERFGPAGREDELVGAARNYIATPPRALPSAYTQLAVNRTLGAKARLALRTAFPGRAVLTSVHGLEPDSRRWLLYAALRPLELLVRRGRIGARILLRSRALRPALRREADRRRLYDWVDAAAPPPPARPRPAPR